MSYQEHHYSGRARHSHHSNSMNTPPPSSSPISNGNFSMHSNGNSSNGNNNQEWSCSECTFLNAGHKKKCDMCLTPKPKKKIQSISTANTNNVNNNNGYGTPKKKGITFSHYDSPISPSPNSPNSINSASRNYPNYPNRRHEQQDQDNIGKVPSYSIIPENVTFNPKKPVSKQTIFERWMIAQIERCSGQQPTICIANNVLLTNLRRVRAPTTHHTIQAQLDNNTNAFAHSNNLDAGDFTDDEEDDHSAMYPDHSPRSQGSANGNYSFTPTPSDTEDDHLSMSFTPNRFSTKPKSSKSIQSKSTQSHTSVFGNGRSRRKATHSQEVSNEDSYNYDIINGHSPRAKTPKAHSHNKHSSKPLTKPKKYHAHSMDENDNGYKRDFPRTLSTDDANMAYNQKKLLNQRRRRKTSRKQQTVSQLWFKAQSQLKQGRNPPILAKYNITLVNIRQHNPRFKDHLRRKSHHEKAATYLQVNREKLHTRDRKNIDQDDDDFSDTEEVSASTPNTPKTPNSYQNIQSNRFDPNAYVE